jgi:hypothetical protein
MILSSMVRGSHVDDALVHKGPAAIIGNLVTVILVMCHRRTNERRPACCEHEERRWIVPVASQCLLLTFSGGPGDSERVDLDSAFVLLLAG